MRQPDYLSPLSSARQWSVVPYRGQSLYLELTDWLASRGFDLWDTQPGCADLDSARMLQMDGVYFRRAAPLSAETNSQSRRGET